MPGQDPVYTTSNGAPIKKDDINVSQRIGNQIRSTNLIQDIHLLELIQHVTKERVPERIVHARGSGAYGFFEVTSNWVAGVSSAAFLNQVGKRTPLFFRGSTTGGRAGSAETVRDGRGFAFKLYTEEGNLDWAFLSTPVFGIRDGIKFPSLIHATKKDPRNNLPNADMFWDFFSQNQEGSHFLSFLFTDRNTPVSYQNSEIFSINTYRFTKQDGTFVYCKIHMKPELAVANLTPAEATRLAGEEPEYHSRLLFEAIEKANRGEGPFPEWKVCAQVLTAEQTLNCPVNIFDPTKTIPFSVAPLQEFGRIVLDRNPENFFAEVEQAAFSPTNVVPGWALTPDPILQTRALAYPDTQRYRIGVNFAQLPVNKPIIQTFNPLMRDGFCTIDNLGSTPNYYPSTFQGVSEPNQHAQPDQEFWQGTIVRPQIAIEDDDFAQPRDFVERVLTREEQNSLVDNVAGDIANVRDAGVRQRAIDNIWKRISMEIGSRIERQVTSILDQAATMQKPRSGGFSTLQIRPAKKVTRVLSAHNEGMFAHLPHVESKALEKANGVNGAQTNGINGIHA